MRFAALAVALILSGPGLTRAAPAAECAPDRVTVLGEDRDHVFRIELAMTPEEQSQGLMFRPSMPEDAGMLFVFEPPRQAAFWMRNTMISLDIIFVGADGRIVNIAERAVPFSEKTLRSDGIVRAVLEINGGLSSELGFGPGTQLIHEAFGDAPAEHACGS